jgi:hypothetical protein
MTQLTLNKIYYYGVSVVTNSYAKHMYKISEFRKPMAEKHK